MTVHPVGTDAPIKEIVMEAVYQPCSQFEPAPNPRLAIHGGSPLRTKKMPWRKAFGESELQALLSAIHHYWDREEDPPYAGRFKADYCNAFAAYMGGGHANAVSSGTAAIYIGLAALQLPKGSEVIISPVTDSGSLTPIILQGHVPVLADSRPSSYNIGVQEFLDRVTPRTRAVLVVHAAGEPVQDMDELVREAHRRGIAVLEDCSQATGAEWRGQKVGTFGDIAAFSTMYRKNLAAGASSGLVFTRRHDLHCLALGHSDRGKPLWRTDLDFRNPGHASFPALNFNTCELSCAIGLASLKRLPQTIARRSWFVQRIVDELARRSKVCRGYSFHGGFSPFYFPIFVDGDRIRCSKNEFAEAVAAEGIGLGVEYGCLVCTWPWARPYMADAYVSRNALDTRDRVFHLYVNECYTETEVRDVVEAILKVESYFLK
jgi:dTDP-4-amino-4,6-dideoxygalactose transaminase